MRDESDSPSEDSFEVSVEESEQRLDRLLALHYPNQSRQYFQGLIESGHVLLNKRVPKKREKPKVGDTIEVCFVLTPEINLEPEAIPLDIIYEDEHLIAVSKPPGMVVHPAPGNWTGTFVNALLYHCKQLDPSGEALRPGIVHRLDKDTSGVIVAAKTYQAHQGLVSLFAERKMEKQYLAVCWGNPKAQIVDAPIGRHPVHRKKMSIQESGKPAVTRIEPLGSAEEIAVVEAYPKTGRTHQIRVHLQSIQAPIVGDSVYGSASVNQRLGVKRQLLHAERLTFPHPITQEPLSLLAEAPADMLTLIERVLPKFRDRYRG